VSGGQLLLAIAEDGVSCARGIQGKEFSIFTLTFDVQKALAGNHSTQLDITEVQLMSDKLKDIKCKIRIAPITISSDKSPLPLPPGKKASHETAPSQKEKHGEKQDSSEQ